MPLLPLPRNSTSGPLEIPCWSLRDYDHGDLEGYPARQGYGDRTAWEWHQTFSLNTDDFRNFLHSWLFWGTLERRLGKKLRVLDYMVIDKETGQPYFSVEELMKEVNDGSQAYKDVPASVENIMRLARDFHSCGRAHSRSDADPETLSRNDVDIELPLQTYIRAYRDQDPRYGQIVFCTHLVMEQVNFAGKSKQVDRFNAAGRLGKKHPSVDPWITQRFLEAGWCWYEIFVLFNQLNNAGKYYISCLDRPHPEHAHDYISTTAADTAHYQMAVLGVCSLLGCKHSHMNQRLYRQQHADGCNGCEYIHVDMDILSRILKSGTFPVVRKTFEAINGRVEIIPYEKNVKFVAISHVWTDGLGNLQANALQSCQLRRLSMMTDQLKDDDNETLRIFLA